VLQPIPPAAECKVNRAVFFFRDFNSKRLAMPLALFDHLLRNEVMMDVNRASAHNSILFNS
jgi:hypothetical protein